jgi:ubiquinone/menaquinone biosynthesis C-methylase UbiE
MDGGGELTMTAGRADGDAAAERARLQQTYGAREAQLAGHDTYALSNPSYLFAIQQRQRAVLRMLERCDMFPLADKRVLELGCGAGGVLMEWLSYGVSPANLHGTDLLAERVSKARALLPHVEVNCADGRSLPYADHSFDVALSFTVFSSILDPALCYTVANELLRVVRPGGLILWYDFWINPVNKQTRGIRPETIRQYFPHCQTTFDRITLAPPLARRSVPVSWSVSLLLENLRVFNTHYLVAIRPAG